MSAIGSFYIAWQCNEQNLQARYKFLTTNNFVFKVNTNTNEILFKNKKVRDKAKLEYDLHLNRKVSQLMSNEQKP